MYTQQERWLLEFASPECIMKFRLGAVWVFLNLKKAFLNFLMYMLLMVLGIL